MLATLITVALMASATATPDFSKASAQVHAANQKMFAANTALKVQVKNSVLATSDTGYAKVFVADSSETACTADTIQQSTYYGQYGVCLTNYDDTTTKYMFAQNTDLSYNMTTMMYSDNACATTLSTSVTEMAGTCATATGAGAMYIMDLQSSYSTASNSYGEQSFNSEALCDAAASSTVTDATENKFGVCLNIVLDGTTYGYKQTGCSKIVAYAATDCSGAALSTDDDGAYADDDDDDDDDFYNYACQGNDDDASAMVDTWTADYCKDSAASMVSPSAFAMLAATAMAAFATMV